jgi:DNA helicase HerA-like ATPase
MWIGGGIPEATRGKTPSNLTGYGGLLVLATGRGSEPGGIPVGIVSGDSRPDYFVFSVDPQNIPQLYDYVYVEVRETPPGSDTPIDVKVLAQVRAVKRLALGVSPDKPWAILRNYVPPRGSDTVVAVAKVLGYRWRGRIYVPRRAPPVGSWVYLAPDRLLEEFYSVEPPRRLHVGSLISRPTVPAYLDLEGFKRHVAIIAATGAGKTWASVVLIEELLKKGATIVVLDPHGEYTAMKRSAFKLGPGFENRVRIVKARKDQEGDIQYRVSVANMPVEELLSVAGVPTKATKIRSVIASAKTVAEYLARASGSRKWLGLRGMSKVIQAAIDAAELARNQNLQAFARQLRRQLSLMYARRQAGSREELQRIARDFEEKLQQLDAEDEEGELGRAVRRLWLALSRDTEPGFGALRYIEELRRIGVYGVDSLPLTYLLQPGTVTVVNLAGLREEVQDHLAYNILSRIFAARVRHVRGLEGESYPYPVVVFVEEAHRFMRPKTKGQTRSREISATIASEGRKFGVFLVAISQRPSRIDPDILSQLQGQIILKIVNPKDQEAVRDSSEQISQDLLENLPGLNTGEAVVVGPITPSPVMIRLRDRVLEYGGGDLSLVEAWTGSIEDLRVVEEYRREVSEKLSQLFGSEVDIAEGVSELLGDTVPRSIIDEALRLLVVGEVWASYSEASGTLYGEVRGPGIDREVKVELGSYTCRRRLDCLAAVTVLLRALLDGVITTLRAGGGSPDSWWA